MRDAARQRQPHSWRRQPHTGLYMPHSPRPLDQPRWALEAERRKPPPSPEVPRLRPHEGAVRCIEGRPLQAQQHAPAQPQEAPAQQEGVKWETH